MSPVGILVTYCTAGVMGPQCWLVREGGPPPPLRHNAGVMGPLAKFICLKKIITVLYK